MLSLSKLNLNSKTNGPILLFETMQQKGGWYFITVGKSVVNTKPVVRNLVSRFDSQLSMSTHISKLCSSAFCHLHNESSVVFTSSLVSQGNEDLTACIHPFLC